MEKNLCFKKGISSFFGLVGGFHLEMQFVWLSLALTTLRTLGRTKDGQLALRDPEMHSAWPRGDFCSRLHGSPS